MHSSALRGSLGPSILSRAQAHCLPRNELGAGALSVRAPPNYRRLQQIKSKHDPKNFFRMNQHIQPLA
jgi:hypothetical protein